MISFQILPSLNLTKELISNMRSHERVFFIQSQFINIPRFLTQRSIWLRISGNLLGLGVVAGWRFKERYLGKAYTCTGNKSKLIYMKLSCIPRCVPFTNVYLFSLIFTIFTCNISVETCSYTERCLNLSRSCVCLKLCFLTLFKILWFRKN